MNKNVYTLFRRIPEYTNPSYLHIFRAHRQTFMIYILIKNACEKCCVLKIMNAAGNFDFLADWKMVGAPFKNNHNAKIESIREEAEACEKVFIDFIDHVYGWEHNDFNGGDRI